MKKDKISFFYNKFSKEIIHASCDSFAFAEFGINNSKVFIPDLNHEIHQLNSKTDSKIFKRAIYEAGWSYLNICDNYCVIGALNLETSKEVLKIATQKKYIKEAFLFIEDLDSISLEADDIKTVLSTGNLGEHLFHDHLQKNIELNELIKEIQLLDCSNQILVFGSVIKGKIVPPDLDIWIDATSRPVKLEDQNKILSLVEKYSLRLDPYIRTENSIFAVDSNISTYEFNWVDLGTTNKFHIVQDFEKWERDAREGVPLNNLNLLPSTIEKLLNNIYPIKKSKFNL